jgi:hypothetical protein
MKLDLDDGYIHMRGANKTTLGNINGYEKSL